MTRRVRFGVMAIAAIFMAVGITLGQPEPKATPPADSPAKPEAKGDKEPAATIATPKPADPEEAKPKEIEPKPPAEAEKPSPSPMPQSPAKPSDPPADKPSESEADEPSKEAPKPAKVSGDQHIVYVPYSKLQEVFENEKGDVLLSFSEYQKLWEAARQKTAGEAKPPVPAILTRLEYTGDVGEDQAKLTARMFVDGLVEEWIQLPVSFPNAAVASVEGGTLAAQAPGDYLLILKGKKLHEVVVQLSIPLQDTPEGKALQVRGPVAASTQLTLSVPLQNLDIDVTPKMATSKVTTAPEKTTVTAVLGATDSINVSWKEQKEQAPDESLTIVQAETLVRLGDGIVHTRTKLDFRILRGEAKQVRFQLPPGERLLDIQGPGVRDWKQAENQDDRTVTVRLYSSAKESLPLQIDSENVLPQVAFSLVPLKPLDVQRLTGVISVTSSPELSVTVEERENVVRVSPSEVPASLTHSDGLFFKYYTANPRLQLAVAPVSPRIGVQAKSLFRLQENRLRGDITLVYDIQRAGIFSVSLRLPSNVEVENVSASAFDRYELRQVGDAQLLEIRLGQQVLGHLTVSLQLSMPFADDANQLRLPLPEPVAAQTERGIAALLAHESYEVTQNEEQSQGLRPATPEDFTRESFSVPTTQHLRLAAAIRYQTRPVQAVYDVRRRETRLVADTFTHVEVKENALLTNTTIVFHVQYAATNSFRIAIPEQVADLAEITGSTIKEKRRAQPEDGQVPFDVVLHTDTLGKHAITVTYSRPIQLSSSGESSAELALLVPQPLDVERESGQIVVTKERSLALEETVESAEPIDPRLISVPEGIQYAADDEIQFAYRYYRHPLDITLTVTRHEVQRVIETVVSRALVETVVPEQGTITYRARFRVKSSQRQRLRLAMPAGTRFLGVTVAGRTVVPEKAPGESTVPGREEYLINVSRSTGSEEPFNIMMLYEQGETAPQLERLTFLPNQMPKLAFEMPLFMGDVAFQRLYWQVWLPRRYTVIGRPIGFTDENRSHLAIPLGVGFARDFHPEINEWENDWQKDTARIVFEFATVGRQYTFSSLIDQPLLLVPYGYIPAMVVSASVAVFLLMTILTPLRLGGKLTLSLLVVFGFALASLYEPESVHRWISASRIGVLFGLALWGIHALITTRRSVATWWTSKTTAEPSEEESEEQAESAFDLSEGATTPVVPPDSPPDPDPSSSPANEDQGDRPRQGGSHEE